MTQLGSEKKRKIGKNVLWDRLLDKTMSCGTTAFCAQMLLKLTLGLGRELIEAVKKGRTKLG